MCFGSLPYLENDTDHTLLGFFPICFYHFMPKRHVFIRKKKKKKLFWPYSWIYQFISTAYPKHIFPMPNGCSLQCSVQSDTSQHGGGWSVLHLGMRRYGHHTIRYVSIRRESIWLFSIRYDTDNNCKNTNIHILSFMNTTEECFD